MQVSQRVEVRGEDLVQPPGGIVLVLRDVAVAVAGLYQATAGRVGVVECAGVAGIEDSRQAAGLAVNGTSAFPNDHSVGTLPNACTFSSH